MKIRKAIIPAAGLGTRFLPATKAQPKEMLPIVDKPSIQFIVEEAIASGIESIIIVTGRNKRAIEDHFDKSFELETILEEKGKTEMLQTVRQIANMADIHYIRQKEPLGLGHAILCARKFVGNEPFAVLLGDDVIQADPPVLKQMIDIYDRFQTSIVAVKEVPWEDVDKYGIISPSPKTKAIMCPNGSHPVEDLVEKPTAEHAPSNLAIIGRYILEPEIFDLLETASPGISGEIQLTDALRIRNRQKKMLAYTLKGKRYDVGDKLGYVQATIEFALQREDLLPYLKEYLISLVENWNPKIHQKLS
ncbi:UTP--glucose-1-phosphate uridylyltransferase [Collibacillus ludicampi]|uniref:UTP--glucose-1-phosphate uridylyltransferase n=1 Tax=Collibacillus ludicampi TaxID=2771369 RepID=A0AAV4LFV5_9BACL|nr:UTP--glucose-1-phosphate uridylyltransferase GalU [Collibacillus ludicampi]GIM46616.1 UTP--glucose-1-phosphate uridylyltransferase [Collibacillus ludicampi]